MTDHVTPASHPELTEDQRETANREVGEWMDYRIAENRPRSKDQALAELKIAVSRIVTEVTDNTNVEIAGAKALANLRAQYFAADEAKRAELFDELTVNMETSFANQQEGLSQMRRINARFDETLARIGAGS